MTNLRVALALILFIIFKWNEMRIKYASMASVSISVGTAPPDITDWRTENYSSTKFGLNILMNLSRLIDEINWKFRKIHYLYVLRLTEYHSILVDFATFLTVTNWLAFLFCMQDENKIFLCDASQHINDDSSTYQLISERSTKWVRGNQSKHHFSIDKCRPSISSILQQWLISVDILDKPLLSLKALLFFACRYKNAP